MHDFKKLRGIYKIFAVNASGKKFYGLYRWLAQETRKFSWTISAIFIIALSFLFVPISHAQSVDLGIYPPVFQIQTVPPSSIKIPFSIQNFADSSVDLIISLKPFTAAPSENGTISFLNDISSYPDPSLLERIQVLDNDIPIQTLTLAPKQKKNLNLTVDVPKDEAKGEYYVALIFTSTNQNTLNSSSTQTTAGISSNILLSVGPFGNAKGYIEDFSTSPFVAKGPIPFNVRIKNTSDRYITPKGDIVIRNMFGQTIGKVNLLPVNILSNTVRRIPDSAQSDTSSKAFAKIQDIVNKNAYPVAVWPEKFLLGPYTANLTIALSDSGPLYKKSIIFFAFPAEYLLGIIIIIMIILFLALRVKRKVL
jgi:hypothetical protein